MGFAKLSDSLVFSSILREDDAVFKVFFLILSQARASGVAPISTDFIASITRKSDTEVDRCLGVLEAPDPKSKTLTDEGRRIRRVDGGFEVINYHKYRQDAEAETVRVYERERKRRQREPVPDMSRNVPGRSASASASPSDVPLSVEGGVWGDPRPEHERVRGSNFRQASDLEIKILRLVREISERTGRPAWEVCRKVTSYKRQNGEMSAGVEDPARLGSILARQKALEDAEWWLAKLDKERANGATG